MIFQKNEIDVVAGDTSIQLDRIQHMRFLKIHKWIENDAKLIQAAIDSTKTLKFLGMITRR